MTNIRCSFGCTLLVLMALGACGPSHKPAHVCDMIATIPNGPRNVPVPGVAYISINPNTPVGNGGAWGGKSESQVVLAFHLFAKQGKYCKMPTVTGVVVEVDPNTSQFVIGQPFALFGTLDGRLIATAFGRVTSDGKMNVQLLGAERLTAGTHYFQLQLDTSGAQHGNALALTSGIIDYEVDGHHFRSYQPPYTSQQPLVY